MRKFFLVLFLLILFFSIYINSLSLWDDKAGDIYNRKIFYNIGDSINIIITESSKFEYKSSTKSLKSYNIDISGGELSGIFNFLPEAYIEEDKNSLDNDNLKIESILQGRVVRVSDNYVTVRGTKRIQLNNKISSIIITGDAYYSDIVDNSIISNKIINSTLTLTTLLDNQRRIITERDLFTEVLNPDATTDIIETTRLTDEKKREILLNFFNKILNLIL